VASPAFPFPGAVPWASPRPRPGCPGRSGFPCPGAAGSGRWAALWGAAGPWCCPWPGAGSSGGSCWPEGSCWRRILPARSSTCSCSAWPPAQAGSGPRGALGAPASGPCAGGPSRPTAGKPGGEPPGRPVDLVRHRPWPVEKAVPPELNSRPPGVSGR
jgi:hypothetical protein